MSRNFAAELRPALTASGGSESWRRFGSTQNTHADRRRFRPRLPSGSWPRLWQQRRQVQVVMSSLPRTTTRATRPAGRQRSSLPDMGSEFPSSMQLNAMTFQAHRNHHRNGAESVVLRCSWMLNGCAVQVTSSSQSIFLVLISCAEARAASGVARLMRRTHRR